MPRSMPRDLALQIGSLCLEALWLYGVLAVLRDVAPQALRVPFAMFVCLAVLALGLAHAVRIRAVALVVVSVWVLLWLHWAIAGDLPASPAHWWAGVTEPWRRGAAVRGTSALLLWCAAPYLGVRALLVAARGATVQEISHGFMAGALAWFGAFALVALARVPASLVSPPTTAIVVLHFAAGMALQAAAQRRAVFGGAQLWVRRSLAFGLAVALPGVIVLVAAWLFVAGLPALSWSLHVLWAGLRTGAAVAWYGARWLVLTLLELLRAAPDAHSPATRIAERNAGPDLPPFTTLSPPGFPRIEIDALPWVSGLALALLLGVLLLTLLQTRPARPVADADDEESGSLWSWQLLRQQLVAAGAALWARARSVRPTSPTQRSETAELRALYRRMLTWAAARGLARRPHITPHELARQLARAVPECAEPVASLTEVYVESRYGAHPVSTEQLAHASQLVDAITQPAKRS